MKRCFLCLFAVIVSVYSFAQDDSSLQKRLNEYFLLNKQLNFEKLMDYIHPNLFAIASREQLVEMFQSIFNDEDMIISMDSLSTTGISPSFSFQKGLYRKIDYYMRFSIKFKDTTVLKDEAVLPAIELQMKNALGAENVKYIQKENRLEIDGTKIMIAIKDDERSEWMFLGYEPKQAQVMETLVPKEVLRNFKL